MYVLITALPSCFLTPKPKLAFRSIKSKGDQSSERWLETQLRRKSKVKTQTWAWLDNCFTTSGGSERSVVLPRVCALVIVSQPSLLCQQRFQSKTSSRAGCLIRVFVRLLFTKSFFKRRSSIVTCVERAGLDGDEGRGLVSLKPLTTGTMTVTVTAWRRSVDLAFALLCSARLVITSSRLATDLD